MISNDGKLCYSSYVATFREMRWATELIWPQSLNPVLHQRIPPGPSTLWCGPACKQMSRKHTRWDGRWLISSAQTEWQSVARMIKSRSREREGATGGMESLCFSSPALDSVEDGKHVYFAHQSVASCRLHRCHYRAIKRKSLRSSANSEWMCVQAIVTNPGFVMGGRDWEKCK